MTRATAEWFVLMLGQAALPEQGVCVGLLLPPKPWAAAHAAMQQLGGLRAVVLLDVVRVPFGRVIGRAM